MNLFGHFDKNNLHHAYLLEGERDQILPKVILFVKSLGVGTSQNPDFYSVSFDSFKVEDARNLKSIGVEKGLSKEKKIFIVSVNNFLPEAQNTLLKIFEEPIENTHFFVIVPDVHALLPTFVSRFYLITARSDLAVEQKEAEKFISMSLKDRIEFLKAFLVNKEDEESELEVLPQNSNRSKSLHFLNALETILHQKTLSRLNLDNKAKDLSFFNQIFKVREYLRQPGSSTKSLMESVALTIPSF